MVLSRPTDARFFDGNMLLSMCEDTNDVAAQGACNGYVAATSDAFTLADTKTTICLPDVTLKQEKDVVVKFLRDHPEHRHEGASKLIYLALESAFPCK
jgi:hypothetical protein